MFWKCDSLFCLTKEKNSKSWCSFRKRCDNHEKRTYFSNASFYSNCQNFQIHCKCSRFDVNFFFEYLKSWNMHTFWINKSRVYLNLIEKKSRMKKICVWSLFVWNKINFIIFDDCILDISWLFFLYMQNMIVYVLNSLLYWKISCRYDLFY